MNYKQIQEAADLLRLKEDVKFSFNALSADEACTFDFISDEKPGCSRLRIFGITDKKMLNIMLTTLDIEINRRLRNLGVQEE